MFERRYLFNEDLKDTVHRPVDMVDSRLHAGYDLHGAGEATILLGELLRPRRPEGELLGQLGPGVDLNIGLLQSLADLK